jgi:Tfp pilus assembly protein PilF
MLRGWLVIVAILLGVAVSFAAGSNPLSGDKRWEEGRKVLADGKAAEAKAAFEELLREYPREPDVHLFLAITSLRLRDPQAAETACQRAIALNPNHVEARTLLGWIYSEIHADFDAAITQYTEVVRLRPELPEAYNNLGVALKRKGELERARGYFGEALERRPEYSAALSNRGWVLAAQGKWAEARRDFEGALQYNPKDDGALFGLSQALREARDYGGAQQALNQLISRSPNFVYWLEWGRIGLIRYYWVLLLVAIALFANTRFRKARKETNGG